MRSMMVRAAGVSLVLLGASAQVWALGEGPCKGTELLVVFQLAAEKASVSSNSFEAGGRPAVAPVKKEMSDIATM